MKELNTPPSKLTPYRLPLSIFAFFIAYTLLTRTPLLYIASSTSMLINQLYAGFDVIKETEQVALIYAILLSVVAHYGVGRFMKIEAKENNKGLLKGLALVVLIAAAYMYNMIQK